MPRPSAVFALTIALILVIAASLAVAVLTIRWGTSEGPATGQIVTLSGVPLASSPYSQSYPDLSELGSRMIPQCDSRFQADGGRI